MTDFWFSVLWTLLVSAATIIADWLAAQFVMHTRGLREIRRALDQGVSDGEALGKIRKQLEDVAIRGAAALVWGADLATVAVALDFSILGIWMSNKSLFPFFQRFNVGESGREIQVWLILLLLHFVLLLASLVIKHLHGDRVGTITTRSGVWAVWWVRRNAWMLLGNAAGFFALLTSFAAIRNAF